MENRKDIVAIKKEASQRETERERKKAFLLFHCLIRNRWKPIKLFVVFVLFFFVFVFFFFFFFSLLTIDERIAKDNVLYIRKRESYSNGSVTSCVFCCYMSEEKEMDARIKKKKARAPPNIICNTLITMTTTKRIETEREKRNCLSTRTTASSIDSNSFARLRYRQHQRTRTRENLPYDNSHFFLFSSLSSSSSTSFFSNQ